MVLRHPCRGSMYGAQAPLQRKHVWCSGTLAEEVCMVLRHPCRGSMYGAQAPLQRKHVWCSGTLAEEVCMVLRHPCRGSMYGAQAPLQKIGRAPSELQSHVNLVCRLLLEKKKVKR